MAKFKPCNEDQLVTLAPAASAGVLPISLQGQLVPGILEHTISQVVDNAGHVSQVSQSFSVDKTLPQLGLSGGSVFCPRRGDVLALSYDVQDALSGISQWTLSASGAVIASNTTAETSVVDWDVSGLGGGTHTLILSVRDAAFLAAVAAEQQAKAEREAIDDELEDEEKAWLEKKAASDKAAAGKVVATASQTVSAATLQAGLMAYYEGRKEGKPSPLRLLLPYLVAGVGLGWLVRAGWGRLEKSIFERQDKTSAA